jgi:hypothetical protein
LNIVGIIRCSEVALLGHTESDFIVARKAQKAQKVLFGVGAECSTAAVLKGSEKFEWFEWFRAVRRSSNGLNGSSFK